jgi:ApaG protein
MTSIPRITVSVITKYLEKQSIPNEDRYAFAYHVTIENMSSVSTKLLTRHWIIIDADQEREEIHGNGVIGEQPIISAGVSYEYTSGVILKTAVGTMEGSYQMIDENGLTFDIPIEPFLLSIPNAVH